MSSTEGKNHLLGDGETQHTSIFQTPSPLAQSARLYYHSSGGRNFEGRKLKFSGGSSHSNPNVSPFCSPKCNLYKKIFRSQMKNPASRYGVAFAALATLGSSDLSPVKKQLPDRNSPVAPRPCPTILPSPVRSPAAKIALTKAMNSIKLSETDWVTVRHNEKLRSLFRKTSISLSESPFANIYSRISKHISPKQKGKRESNDNIHALSEDFKHCDDLDELSSLEFDTPLRTRILQNGIDDFPLKPKILGQGGFGKVIQANLKGYNIAVKIISKRISRTRKAEQCIELERNALLLSHPNIIRTLGVYGLNAESKYAMVIMEYAGSRNLQQVLNDATEDISECRKLKYAFQIGSAMNCCHENNIVHLDIKPANVIIDRNDNCRLGDFGCSLQLGKEQQMSFVNQPIDGTVVYRAPELLKGQNPTSKADIYSYGISLWQLETREFPFANLNPHVVIYKVGAHDIRPSLASVGKNSNLAELFKMCWATDPNDRPTSKKILEIVNSLL